jgi:AraC family transcriptional regulator
VNELVTVPPERASRSATLAHYRRAVARVIRAMHEQLAEPLSLRAMARIALISPYHFCRVFRRVTGVSPSHFLTALRLQEAKRRLLRTAGTVTDVCFDVGYNSLGSFIKRFTKLVGRSPRHVRRLTDRTADIYHPTAPIVGESVGFEGVVESEVPFTGRVVLGVFPTPIPAGPPVACALLIGPGPYRTSRVPDGTYYLLAVGLGNRAGVAESVLCDDALRGRAGPFDVRDGRVTGPTKLVLRPPLPTDPPILVALPFLGSGLPRPG